MHARYACCLRVSPLFSVTSPLLPHPSFLTIAFFFLSLLLDRTGRAFAPGTRLLPDREAIDRARTRWLPSKGQPNRPIRRDRISIFHRVRLRITCPCAPHANRPFAYLDELTRLTIGKLYAMWRVDIAKSIVSLIGWGFLRSTGKGEERSFVWFITWSTFWEDSRSYLV